ncbi:MAG: [protein-PII] uridylyltransferase [Zetaproteobacteria bacterium CG12_big_fil_rev_8_21_14_0_65_55_1124]|nr:MAG: [protein-PII] uridylyltransferase [Zetaproteobacteria bacterium CG08_land_8_20_14_0_20_55_17]PIW42920.1 MAG: [protein-PII] uridylyltransferase [Zetaproteobacteria bacterium CG12_big_fil_rev_8_21_14_0_65_55_1124]PIY51857.1 MAG: [protein-PII] uridylyltransferase [Zetaproteobacteria bacterium CG_4_10_14_0_8_um_filter_55_43]PIZ39917.1 MAG: [protein-PII] uridylyltransferase [Zetaproteobacteria bacterium CG_4_10_14_0_2_um_filter_55_20]PJB79798.1 MAG: [protein-PII] uridylyltransferase [Zetapro
MGMSSEVLPAARYAGELKKLLAETETLFAAGEMGSVLVHRLSDGVDSLLRDIWQEMASDISDRVDLLAVGGFGRGELCPYSDWDLWFLLGSESDAQVNERIERFIYVLWDMNVKLGHAVRTVDETIEAMGGDGNTATAALEMRLICGSGAGYAVLRGKVDAFFARRRKAFVEAKLDEMQQRHHKAGDTAFLMEPDLKEGRGGLRDVQTVFWLARAWHGSSDIRQLVELGFISETEHMHLMQAQDFLYRCRVGLHVEAGRGNDRLGFMQQMQLAERMGYRNEPYRPGVEVFMKDYFRHAGRIQRVSGLLCLHFQEELHPQWLTRRRDIGDGFVLEGQRLGVRDGKVFEQDPLRLLRIFHVAQEGKRHLSGGALRQVREHGGLIDDAFIANPEAQQTFLDILSDSRNVSSVLKEMNDTGILGRFIPEFRHAVGLGQFNNYHAYTVDEHTIRAVAEARNMAHRLHGERLTLACDIFARLQRPELLYIAILCHDIAKGMPGDHSDLGAVIAADVCRRLGVSRDAQELVSWLVRHHLLMAITSQRCDLTDPHAIASFAEKVSDMERLRYLLCLSVADIAAVGPGVWNEWKGSLLRELYLATERHLMGEEDASRGTQERVAVRIESTLAKVQTAQRSGLKKVLQQLPWRAVMGFPPRHLLRVGSLMQASPEGGVDVLVDQSRGESLVFVLAPDRKRLLADLTAALSSGYVNIVAAHAYQIDANRVLDVFHVQGGDGKALSEKSDLHRLQQRMQKVVEGEDVSRAKPGKQHILMHHVSVSARPLPLASSRQTAIEVVAADRTGLLAALATEIDDAGFSVRGASISTFGERVVDVFFLTHGNGDTLSPAEVDAICERLSRAAELPTAA